MGFAGNHLYIAAKISGHFFNQMLDAYLVLSTNVINTEVLAFFDDTQYTVNKVINKNERAFLLPGAAYR